MKQVARKSTTGVPQKVSAGSHRPNGLMLDSLAPKTLANVTSDTSSASSSPGTLNVNRSDKNKDSHLANGMHDGCKQVIRNRPGSSDSVPNKHDSMCASADTVQQQNVELSACTATDAHSSAASVVNVRLPTPQISSNTENSKKLKDGPLKPDGVETTRLSSRTASEDYSANSLDDVIIVKADENVDSKPGTNSTKRSISLADDKHVEAKKARVDGAFGQSSKLAHKVLIYLHFSS